MFSERSNNNITKLCVVGAGPVGLAFIASLITDAKKTQDIFYEIIVIEKRGIPFSRQQRLVDIKPNASPEEESWESFSNKLFQFNKLDFTSSHGSPDKLHARKKLAKKFDQQSMAAISRQTIIKIFQSNLCKMHCMNIFKIQLQKMLQ